jgi:hypothetical protein
MEGTNVTTIYQARLATILSRIDADPSCWDQFTWHCGTSHCLAGHAQIDSGRSQSGTRAAAEGAHWLGMSPAVARWAFSSSRTLTELRSLLDYDVGSARDPAGFDSDGFDSNGYACNGRDS